MKYYEHEWHDVGDDVYYVTMKYYEHEMIWDGMMCTKLLSYYE
jgi:hypothetical protein